MHPAKWAGGSMNFTLGSGRAPARRTRSLGGLQCLWLRSAALLVQFLAEAQYFIYEAHSDFPSFLRRWRAWKAVSASSHVVVLASFLHFLVAQRHDPPPGVPVLLHRPDIAQARA
jgi:hypothetical protein